MSSIELDKKAYLSGRVGLPIVADLSGFWAVGCVGGDDLSGVLIPASSLAPAVVIRSPVDAVWSPVGGDDTRERSCNNGGTHLHVLERCW